MKINNVSFLNVYRPNRQVAPVSFERKKIEIPDEELSTRELLGDMGSELRTLSRKYEILKQKIEQSEDFGREEVRRNQADMKLDLVLLNPSTYNERYRMFKFVLSHVGCDHKQAKRMIEHLHSFKPDDKCSLMRTIVDHCVDKNDVKTLYLISDYCNALVDKKKKVDNPPYYERVIDDSVYVGICTAAIEMNELSVLKHQTLDILGDDIQNKLFSHACSMEDTDWIEDNYYSFTPREETLMNYVILINKDKSKRMDLELVFDAVYIQKDCINRHDKEFLKKVDEELDKYTPVEDEEKRFYNKLRDNIVLQLNDFAV